MLTWKKISRFFGNGADSSRYVYLEIFIHRDGFCFSRDGGEGETIRVKWPKFSQQISLTKIQSRLVAIEGCIVGPWKMAVGNNRIMLLALRCRDEMGKRRRKRENKRRERHSRIWFDTLKINWYEMDYERNIYRVVWSTTNGSTVWK